MDLGADFAIHQSSDGLPLIVEAFLSQRITKIDISRFVVKKQNQFGMAAPGAVPTPASDTAESARLKIGSATTPDAASDVLLTRRSLRSVILDLRDVNEVMVKRTQLRSKVTRYWPCDVAVCVRGNQHYSCPSEALEEP